VTARRSTAARDASQDGLGYHVVSHLIDYPTERLQGLLPAIRDAVPQLSPEVGQPLRPLLDHLQTTPLERLEEDYVATFDLRRRCCLYLTYYAYGDTRKRGVALLAFKQAYARAGLRLADTELPDHLAVVLEFAATHDLEAGRKLLEDHRAGLELLAISLRDSGSPYQAAIAAVTATLAPLRGDERTAVERLIASGPPEEEVGVEPYDPRVGPGAFTPGSPSSQAYSSQAYSSQAYSSQAYSSQAHSSQARSSRAASLGALR
jgi:nitrate reductase molybdenum cofactor assembly chaperone